MSDIDPRNPVTSKPVTTEASKAPDQSAEPAGRAQSSAPGSRAPFWVLVALMVAGVIGSPWLLGQFAPSTYRMVALGGVNEYAELAEKRRTWEERLDFAREQGWDSALEFEEASAEAQLAPLERALIIAEAGHARQATNWLNAVALALVGVMLAKGMLLGSGGPELSARLDIAAAGLAGLWLAGQLVLWDALPAVNAIGVVVMLILALLTIALPVTGRRVPAGER